METDILAILFLSVELVGMATAVHAVFNARTSQSAIAWAISLVTFPWLALLLYAVFGRNRFHGYVKLRTSQTAAARQLIEDLQSDALRKNLICDDLCSLRKTFRKLAHMPVTRHNQCDLLVDGQDTFAAIFKGMDSARDYILAQFYTVKDDRLGNAFKTKLMEKAAQGVRVYFLYDEIGSHKLPRAYLDDLRSAGVQVSAFHTTKGKANRFQLNFRNHRKIVVVDGGTAYAGGCNVGDEYVSQHPRFGDWRDTHMRIRGPAVLATQTAFIEDWCWATGHIPPLNWTLEKAPQGDQDLLVIPSGPADILDTCSLMFVHAINSARERIWISSPYFIPDQQVLTALKLAALRDVDVRLLLPEKADHRTIHVASFAHLQRLIPVGVKLYRYTSGFLHQKVFLIDSRCAAVGSANLDNRSFRLNFEITVLNFAETFIADVDAMLRRDFAKSRPVRLEDYLNRSMLFKLAVRTARLLDAIL